MNAPDASAAERGDPNRPEDYPADESEKPDTSLCPNRADIDRHLFELFSPVFVHPYPDAWIEIAYANPATGGKPDEARHFSAFDLAGAAKFAEAKNKDEFNIYVGAALRQGKTTSKSKGRASGANFLAASHVWAEFDNKEMTFGSRLS